MPLRNAKPLNLTPVGLTDATDGTNAFRGAMASLANLIPSPTTMGQFVPRPAATQLTNFIGDKILEDAAGAALLAPPVDDPLTEAGSGLMQPGEVSALIVIGTRAYGMIASQRFAGKDEPFCFDLIAGDLVFIAGATADNCPTTQPSTGDWTPPTMTMVASKLLITHPGYDGITAFVGWIDVRGFSIDTITGDTHTDATLDTLSANPLQSGVQVGDLVTSSSRDVPIGTTVAALTATAITLSEAATGTNAGVTLTIASGTLAAPLYGAGQVNGVGLAAVPAGVGAYNGRAWWAVNNGLQFSDADEPLQQTNATQQLNLGDSTPVTAVAGLPLGSQIIGGIIQSLIAFKGAGPMWQITGDQATANLQVSAIEGSVGTVAPNSIAATPRGLAYIAPDGLRIIDQAAQVSDPIGAQGQGVSQAFVNAVSPTRMAAAYNQDVYRVSVQNGAINGQPTQEYWLHLGRHIWTGPHSFPAALIQSYYKPGANTFIMASATVTASLWQSDVTPAANSTYTENGTPLAWSYAPTLLPDNGVMAENCVIESALGLALAAGSQVSITAADEQGDQLAAAIIAAGGAMQSVWGAFTWGRADWQAQRLAYQQYAIEWPNELTFKQLSVAVTGLSAGGDAIGNLYLRYQILGFLGV